MPNAYFTQMHAARRAGKASFSYKGKKYVRSKTKTGLITYKKSTGTGGSVRTGGSVSTGGSVRTGGAIKGKRKAKKRGGSVVSGGAMSEPGKAVNKYGRRATTLARKATNTVYNHGPDAYAKAKGMMGGAMSGPGKAVNKYGRRATTIARKATNTVYNHGPDAYAKAQEVVAAMGGRVRKRRTKKY